VFGLFWAVNRQTGMYGPPLCRKRKMRVTVWSAQMYSAFVGVQAPGQDGMRCAPFPINYSVSKDFFRLQVWGAPGSTVVPSHGSPADLAEFKTSQSSLVCRCGNRAAISKPVVRQAPSADRSCRPVREADRHLRWRVRPMPCGPVCWPGRHRRRCSGCAMTVLRASAAGRSTACLYT